MWMLIHVFPQTLLSPLCKENPFWSPSMRSMKPPVHFEMVGVGAQEEEQWGLRSSPKRGHSLFFLLSILHLHQTVLYSCHHKTNRAVKTVHRFHTAPVHVSCLFPECYLPGTYAREYVGFPAALTVQGPLSQSHKQAWVPGGGVFLRCVANSQPAQTQSRGAFGESKGGRHLETDITPPWRGACLSRSHNQRT